MDQVYRDLELANSEIERLNSTLSEKESMIEHLTCTNSRQRSYSDGKLKKLEEENFRLLKALEEAEEKKKVEDQLKWKKEQFELLKQAHEKLKGQFETSKREWESEKSSLLDEINTTQSTLDSQTQKTESLRAQLDWCKQALAHEESRRRNLESTVSDMKARLESAADECRHAKSRVYTETSQRDGEMAALRDSLRVMESDLKEAEYKGRKLEKENQDLLASLSELQEAHIPKAASTPPSAVAKIKSKLRSVEQAHKDCSLNLRSKEADWKSQMQMMKKDLDEHKFCLKMKEASIKDLKKELEGRNATNTELKLQNEELSLMLQLLRTEFSETTTQSMADTTTVEKVEQHDEFHKYREMLDESCREQASLKQEVQELSEALERLNCELTEKVFEGSEIELELQIWRLTAERLQVKLEENQQLRRELEVSLLAQAGFEEQLKLEMCNLKQQFGLTQFEDKDEEEIANKQILNVGKVTQIRASDERSPFREIN